MSQIYLSPRRILSRLKTLELRVPVMNSVAYVPETGNNFNTEQDLEREAVAMLRYVGLRDCKPRCQYRKIEGNFAGFTMNNRSLQEIDITVNELYRGLPKACRAVLAHEICHKVIYLNGIDYPNPTPDQSREIEIFTDLCTIFIGLGRVVLDGYIDAGSKRLKMGYLEVDMYRQTYDIVARTTGRYIATGDADELNDPLLEDALAVWGSGDDAKKVLRDSFMKNEESLSIVNRNILLLKQILEQIYTSHGEIFRSLSREATEAGVYGEGRMRRPIALFGEVYESMFDRSQEQKFSTAQSEIYNLILSLTDEYKDIDLGALSYAELRCPNCGHTSSTKIEDRDAVVRCGSCGIYFRFCNTRLNITKMRRERAELQLSRERAENELKKARQRVADEKSALETRLQRLEADLKTAYERGLAEGHNRAKTRYDRLVADIPKWKWKMLGNTLPEEW